MKKSVLTLLLSCAVFSTIAQNRIYGSFSTGNTAQSDALPFNINLNKTNHSTPNYQHQMCIYLSKGHNITGAIGYQKNRFSAELGLTAFEKATGTLEFEEQDYGLFYAGPISTLNFSSTTSGFSLKPKISYRFTDKKLAPYLTLGANLSSITTDYSRIKTDQDQITYTNAKLYDGLSWGHNLGIGLDYRVNKKLNLFWDVGYIHHIYKPKHLDIEEYTEYNGNFKNEKTSIIQRDGILLEKTSSSKNTGAALLHSNLGIKFTLFNTKK